MAVKKEGIGKEELSVVGKNWARLDGADKVSGRSIFADDVRLPGMLYGKIVRSPHACARIVGIDTSEAEALPGVKAIVTSGDAQGIVIGLNQPLLPRDSVKYIGHEVAAVAALDEATAAEAAKRVRVEYEMLDGLVDVRKAMAEDAPQLHEKARGNVGWEENVVHGDPDAAFAECAYIREDEYVTNPSHNCYAEYHVCVADFSKGDQLTMYTPTQTALLFQKSLAAGFRLTDSDVRMLTLNTGGGFTGRTSVRPHHFLAALLSRKAGRPVCIRASGDEEFIMCHAGGKVYYKLKSGATKDGRVKVIEADLLFDVRFLRNPYYDPRLKPQTGLSAEVSDYVLAAPEAGQLLAHLDQLLKFVLPLYDKEGKSYLTISVGCTGGRHRSVVIANELAATLRREDYAVAVVHRDLERS